MIKISETELYNIFFCSRRCETGHKLSLPFQLFSAIIQAASGRSGAVIGKFSAHGARIRVEIRIFPFARVNEVSEVSAGGILDLRKKRDSVAFFIQASFPWQERKGRYAMSRNGVCDNSGMLIGHF